MAEVIIKHEQEIRLGECSEKDSGGHFIEISPMKYFVFTPIGDVYPIWGEMFGEPQDHPEMDAKQQTALLVKIIVNVLDSRHVLHITEAWSAGKCHSCGEKYTTDKESCACGAKRCQPRDNPYADEILMCNVTCFDGHKEGEDGMPLFNSIVWTYKIIRDNDHKIIEFETIQEKDSLFMRGRLVEHWLLQSYELPQMLLNYAQFCDAFGVDCPSKLRESAELALSAMPKDYPLLKWGIHSDINEVIEIVKERHARAAAE